MIFPIPLTLLPFLLLPSFSIAINILIPLYLYPGDGASAWSPIFSTISAHPAVQFLIVVNPNSGPGTTGALTDSNLIAGISKLNSFSNVKTLGYVLTGYGSRDNNLVNADVDIYASWSGDTKMDGIYFDEVSNDATSQNFDRMASLSGHARDSIGGAFVAYNPGYRAPTELFSTCDLMVEFEHPLADFMNEGVLDQIPQEFAGKSAVQILDTPEGSDVAGLMGQMKGKGLGAVFFGSQGDEYKVFERALLESMAGNA
ncbi:MAG: hypothetical protein L6R41_002139 [Letrouitia leprolyta]|nr:MAG: hypothetical protein L6R41_002139 [Letrouitia leprolyta]